MPSYSRTARFGLAEASPHIATMLMMQSIVCRASEGPLIEMVEVESGREQLVDFLAREAAAADTAICSSEMLRPSNITPQARDANHHTVHMQVSPSAVQSRGSTARRGTW